MNHRGGLRRLAAAAAAVAVLTAGVLLTAARAQPGPSLVRYTYATEPDGVRIALAISFPSGYSAGSTSTWPALFEMDGYDGGGGALDAAAWGNHYVLIHASIRGTG